MKFLFDANISYRLVPLISDVYPQASHVREHDLQAADDDTIWEFARKNNYVIVSKDTDFHQRSFFYGFPPKVIWIKPGNCSTKTIEKVLKKRKRDIERFYQDDEAAFFVLF